MAKQKKKKKQKTKKAMATKVILMPDEETAEEEDLDEKDSDDEDEESGIYLDKESIQIIYNALSKYKPTKDEENVYGVLHEQFEEMLVVEYGVRLPGFEFMDEEDDKK